MFHSLVFFKDTSISLTLQFLGSFYVFLYLLISHMKTPLKNLTTISVQYLKMIEIRLNRNAFNSCVK